MSAAGAVDEALAARVRDEIFAPLGNEETLSYKELEEAARNVMNYYMGFRRSMTGMTDYPEINPEMAKPLLLMRGENGPVYQWGKAPLL